jgi:hypothetical protein
MPVPPRTHSILNRSQGTVENEAVTIDGWFWSAETPDLQAPGQLVFPSWSLPVLHLEATIVEQTSIRGIRGGLIDMGDPDDIVRGALPITIHGQTANGENITLLRAHAQGPQRYRVHHCVLGSLIPGDDTPFSAVRYQLDADVLWSHMGVAEASSELGTLRRLSDEDGTWFVFTPTEAMTLRDLGRRVLVGSLTLARLAQQRELTLGPAFVRKSETSTWLPWYTKVTAAQRIGRFLGDWFVDPRAISLQHIADWLAVSAKLNGLDAAIANEETGDILELRALVLGTMAEGLHRRLFTSEVRFPKLETAQRKAVRAAGKEALAQAVNGFGETAVPEDFKDIVGGFNDVRARQRLVSIKTAVDEAVPELLDQFADWPGLVKDTRNNLAHWLNGEDAPMPTEDEKLLVYLSLPWALRTLLLYRGAKIDANFIREGYSQKDEYEMFRANVRAILDASS